MNITALLFLQQKDATLIGIFQEGLKSGKSNLRSLSRQPPRIEQVGHFKSFLFQTLFKKVVPNISVNNILASRPPAPRSIIIVPKVFGIFNYC